MHYRGSDVSLVLLPQRCIALTRPAYTELPLWTQGLGDEVISQSGIAPTSPNATTCSSWLSASGKCELSTNLTVRYAGWSCAWKGHSKRVPQRTPRECCCTPHCPFAIFLIVYRAVHRWHDYGIDALKHSFCALSVGLGPGKAEMKG